MKKLVALFLSMLMLLLLVSCGGNAPITNSGEQTQYPETLQIVSGFSETREYDEDSYQPIVSVGYPYVNLYGEDAKTYPRLNLVLEENYEAIRDEKLSFIEDVQLEYAENTNAPAPYQNTEKAYIRRADTKVLSILRDCYSYTGGIHGYSCFITENYDTSTGKQLSLSDVVTDTTVLPDFIWTQLNQNYPDIPWFEDINLAEWIGEDLIGWTLDYNGITFYFNPYDLAPYAYGRQQVTLHFAEFPDLVAKEYQSAPAAYGVELPEFSNFYYDVNQDGVADTISWANRSNDDVNETITISLNGTEYSFDSHSFETGVTFLATSTGDCYLYVENSIENDYQTTYFYRLGNTVEQTGQMAGGMRYHIDNQPQMHFVEDVLTNPDSFQMSTRTQMASTVSGYRTYTVGENGLAKTTDPYYHFDENERLTFTALIGFTAEIYDENSHTAKGTVTVSEGEKVVYYATDAERYIWLLLEDGTLCRKEVTLQEHRLMIDGYYVQDVFEGVMYAG